MSGPAVVVWDEALTRYDFGPGHPFDPVRLGEEVGDTLLRRGANAILEEVYGVF